MCVLIDIYLKNWNICSMKLTFIQIKHKWMPHQLNLNARMAGCYCCCCRCHCRQRRHRHRHRHHHYILNAIVFLPAVVVSLPKMVKIYAFILVNIELKWFMNISKTIKYTHIQSIYGNQIKHSYFQEWIVLHVWRHKSTIWYKFLWIFIVWKTCIFRIC